MPLHLIRKLQFWIILCAAGFVASSVFAAINVVDLGDDAEIISSWDNAKIFAWLALLFLAGFIFVTTHYLILQRKIEKLNVIVAKAKDETIRVLEEKAKSEAQHNRDLRDVLNKVLASEVLTTGGTV